MRGKIEPAQFIFSPTQTKEYQIKVDFVSGTDIGKGPHAYTLTIERAQFKPHTALKHPRTRTRDSSSFISQIYLRTS